MKQWNKWIAFGLLLLVLVLVNIIGHLTRGQADLTDHELFTLSPGSRSLLAGIDEPVTLRFYFSRSVEGAPIQFKNYGARVEDLLRQYENAGRGKLRLEVIDPRPDTPEEEAAIRAGIAGQPLPTGETLFFGLLAIQADQERTIPIFSIQRESFLEFDISQILHRVQQVTLPRLGIVSSLPVLADPFQAMMGGPSRGEGDWAFVENLRNQFEIEPVEGDELPENLDVLAVIHPQNLSNSLLFEIDQFLLSGKPVFAAVDPSSFIQKSQMNQQQMMMGQAPSTSSDLSRLFSSWGLEYDASMVVGDPELAAEVNTGSGRAIRYPVWLAVDRFNKESPPTAQLNQMLFPEPGSFRLSEDSALELTPLITTTAKGGQIFGATLTYTAPEQVGRQLQTGGGEQVLAGLVRGSFSTAFPEGRPAEPAENDGENQAEEPEAAEPESFLSASQGNSTLFLIADTDFLADQFSVRTMNFLGTLARSPLNDNLAFASNISEFLAGSEDLIGLRGKGTARRPFERVQEIELAAQENYEEQLAALEQRLQEVQAKLQELLGQQQEQGRLVASPEMQEAIESFRLQEAEMRGERREIRKRLREDIERLKLNLILANLLIVPTLVGIFGINFFLLRNRRQKH